MKKRIRRGAAGWRLGLAAGGVPGVLAMGAAAQIFQLAVAPSVGHAGETSSWDLARALAQVAESNPDAHVAMERVREAEAQLAEARSELWPQLNASTGYAVTDNPTRAFMMRLDQRHLMFGGDFNDPDTTDNWGSEVLLEYPIYAGGARRAAIDAAGLGAEAAVWDAEAVRRRLELEVARAFFEIRGARETVVAAEAALAGQRANLDLAKKRFAEKAELRSAVLDFEAKVAEAESGLVVAQNARDLTVSFLRTLLGLGDEEGSRFVVADRGTTVRHPGGASAARPEVEALALRGNQAEADVRRVRAARKPVVSAFASGRYDEGVTESGGGGSWLLGLNVRLKIWDGGETKAAVAAAGARRSAVRGLERKRVLAIAHETKRAELDLSAARKRIVLAKKAIASAEESLELTRRRFAEGLALSTQLIDAERAVTAARVGLAAARADEQASLASLRHARGLPILGTAEAEEGRMNAPEPK